MKLIDIMDTQLLTFWNLLSFFLLLIALYLYFFRRNSSSKMAENSSKSIYDFTVKVPFFWCFFNLIIYLKNCFLMGQWKNIKLIDFYFSDLILFVICTTIAGYQWKWCESESIQRKGSAGCQCCLTMVT